MNEREALAELDALLDLEGGARTAALARLAERAPATAATVSAWLAADGRAEPRLDRDHYTPLVPPLDDEPDGAGANAGDRIGPYRLVRHPGYAALILLGWSGAVALGSYLAILPHLVIVALFVRRAALEDRFLHQELVGYADYAARVRYRLIPGVW